MGQSRDEVKKKVLEIIADQVGMNMTELNEETSFGPSGLNADSLDAVELVMRLEDDFIISIPEKEAEGITTIGQAIDAVMTGLEKKETDPKTPPTEAAA